MLSVRNGNLEIHPPTVLPGSQIEIPHVILGDSAFPVKESHLRPYTENPIINNLNKRIFN